MFFESSSELPISVDDLRGRPSESLLAAEDVLDDGVVVLAPESLSLAALLLPYLLFKYLAHELRAAPSFSVAVDRSGELSLDFKAWEDRLLARSCPDVAEP